MTLREENLQILLRLTLKGGLIRRPLYKPSRGLFGGDWLFFTVKRFERSDIKLLDITYCIGPKDGFEHGELKVNYMNHLKDLASFLSSKGLMIVE